MKIQSIWKISFLSFALIFLTNHLSGRRKKQLALLLLNLHRRFYKTWIGRVRESRWIVYYSR